MKPSGGDPFDHWLGHQLRQHASLHSGPTRSPDQAQYAVAPIQGAVHIPVLAKLVALVTTKAVIGLSAGILAAGAASAGEAVITGSSNPHDWGQQVVQQVQKCKGALASGSHGIGDCASSFASRHGKKLSSQPQATPTPIHLGDHTAGPVHGKVRPVPGGASRAAGRVPPTPGGTGHPTAVRVVHPTPHNHGHHLN
jgi:hypothetical protein